MRMVSFRLSRECREVQINPAKVLYVCHYEHGASCIHFGKDCSIRVQGDVAEVVSKIEAALTGADGVAGRGAPADRPQATGMN